jgi:hypothetical protein
MLFQCGCIFQVIEIKEMKIQKHNEKH